MAPDRTIFNCSKFQFYGFSLTLFALCCFIPPVNSTSNDLQTLTDENWRDILQDEWLVKFYAPWCPACRNLEPTWKSLGEWARNRDIRIGDVDVTEQSALSGRFMITALPTVYHVKDGEFRAYTGPRTFDDFIKFIDDEEWKNVSPVSSWKAPESYLMSGISNLFQFSVKLKDVHTQLTDVYGLPVWVSFIMFGLVILSLGLLLGMVLVLVTDYFFGPPEAQQDTIEHSERDEVEDVTKEDESKEDADKSDAEKDDEERDATDKHVEDVTPGNEAEGVRRRVVQRE